MIYPLVKSYVLCSTHVTQLIWLLIICPLLIIEHSSYTIFTVYNYIHLCFSLSTYVKPVCYIVYFTIYILYLGRAMALWKNLKVVIPNNVVNNLISYKFNPVITLIVELPLHGRFKRPFYIRYACSFYLVSSIYFQKVFNDKKRT